MPCSGRNGKSKFLGALQHVMADYAKTADPQTFLVKDRASIPNDIAALAGARLVVTNEVQDGKQLAESLVKQLTGGDMITARFLHAEFFEFTPTFKVFLAANHLPRVKGTDHAMWARIHLIPFTVTIPEDEQDKQLASKLAAEAPGILRWMVEGCLVWQRDGLNPPAKVREATAEYRSEMDVLSQFLEDCCLCTADAQTPSAQLYAVFTDWCESHGERPWAQRTFGCKLRERGFVPGRTTGGVRIWCGLDLRQG